jgi:hypothetical protein
VEVCVETEWGNMWLPDEVAEGVGKVAIARGPRQAAAEKVAAAAREALLDMLRTVVEDFDPDDLDERIHDRVPVFLHISPDSLPVDEGELVLPTELERNGSLLVSLTALMFELRQKLGLPEVSRADLREQFDDDLGFLVGWAGEDCGCLASRREEAMTQAAFSNAVYRNE